MKLYKDMTSEEQLQWVTDFSQFVTDRLPLLEQLGDNWQPSDRKDMETGLKLIAAFPMAHNFAKNSLFLGDYQRRVDRLRFYVDSIKEELAENVMVKGKDGETYAYIPAMQRRPKRGRPTREEAYQRKLVEQNGYSDDVKKDEKIALLLGMQIVTDKEPREKNNAELQAEREEQEAEAAKQPNLFSSTKDAYSSTKDAEGTKVFSDGSTKDTKNMEPAATESLPVSATLPHLDQIKWLLSDDLQVRVDNVRALRGEASAMAERAKLLAEQGKDPSEIAPLAQQAAKATKSYNDIYEAVDRELAKVWLRLREDKHYIDDMKAKYKAFNADILIKLLRPYYNKVSEADPIFTTSVRAWLDENNPEAVAAREKAAETKKQADAIIKYLRRTDKQPTKKRIEGMKEKYHELVKLIGEDEAKVYIPFIEKTITDNVEYEKQKLEKKK